MGMMVITFYMTDYNAFALTGRDCSNTGDPQGAATLALGYGLHWAFSPPLQVQNDYLSIRNGEAMPKLQYKASLLIAMW